MLVGTRTAILLAGLSLTACGTYVPEMQEFNETQDDQTLHEVQLIQQIRCEIARGALQAIAEDKGNRRIQKLSGYNLDWFTTWTAKISLKMSVDEKGALLPGLTIKDPWFPHMRHGNAIPRSFSLAANLKASSQSTRTETIGFEYKFADLLKSGSYESCKDSKSIMADDLKIGDFIRKKVIIAVIPNTIGHYDGTNPFNAFNYQVTFAVIYGANANPVWTLVDIAGNNAGPLVDITRTKNNDLTITMGPTEGGKSTAVDQLYQASLIGQAIARELEGRRLP